MQECQFADIKHLYERVFELNILNCFDAHGEDSTHKKY